MSNWFHSTLLQDEDTTDEALVKIIERRKTLLKMWAVVWIGVLIMAFTAIVTVRAAIGLPIF